MTVTTSVVTEAPVDLEPLDFYITFEVGPNTRYTLHRDERCPMARTQDMGVAYTKTEAQVVLRNRDVPACPCVIA